MYRPVLNNRDRGGAITAVVAIHAALLFAFLHLSGRIDLADPESALQVFDLRDVPPPPEPPPPPLPKQEQAAKPKKEEGGSAPNLKSEATPVNAPKPKVVIPPVPQIATSETPRNGTAPTQGASTISGLGTGTGGSGNGNGSGSGSGGGGDGGVAEPPRLASPVLTGRDIPRGLLDRWPPGLPVFLRLRVSPQGTVSECNVLRGTGNPAIDDVMCNIAHERLRFRPAMNRSGQAVAGWFGYAQRPPR